MSNAYAQIYAHNAGVAANVAWTLPPSISPNSMPDGLGYKLLQRAGALAGLADTTFEHLFKAFCDEQFRAGWVWKPAGGGFASGALLDGTKLTGECQHFALNLLTLARAPQPYGMGLVNVEKVNYPGANDQGFVAVHNGTHMTLKSNVLPLPDQPGDRLYFWENHKVIKWNNQYWDPCYRTEPYNAVADMARYELTGEHVRTDKTGVWDSADLESYNKGCTAEKATYKGRFFFFRRQSASEAQETGCSLEGPISETELEIMRRKAQGISMGAK